MKYRITGTNHETGARMTLEFEAGSKAAAERKAGNAGMDVQHVQDMSDGEPQSPQRQTHRGEQTGGVGSLLKMILILALIAAVGWLFWPKLMGWLHRIL